GVKRVRRLAEFEHHKIGDVDDVVDRANADALDLRAQPLRARSDFHVVDLTGGEKWTFASRGDGHAGLLDVALRFARRRLEFFSSERRDFARESEMTEQIATIRRDLDIQDRIARKKIANRSADLRFRRQNQKAGSI